MEVTKQDFFIYWRSQAACGLRVLGIGLKFEYEHRQRSWIALMLNIACEGDFKMARGKGTNVVPPEQNGLPVFVNCTMPTSEKTKVQKFGEDADKIWLLGDQLMLAGYKITWSFDKSRGAYVTSLTCKNPEDGNYNHTLSAWSSGWYDALVAALYKHFVYLSSDWKMALTVKSEDVFG